MYFPAVGRFTSEDPKGFAAGDENLYRYVGNNPTNYTDPSGLKVYAEGLAAAEGLVAADLVTWLKGGQAYGVKELGSPTPPEQLHSAEAELSNAALVRYEIRLRDPADVTRAGQQAHVGGNGFKVRIYQALQNPNDDIVVRYILDPSGPMVILGKRYRLEISALNGSNNSGPATGQSFYGMNTEQVMQQFMHDYAKSSKLDKLLPIPPEVGKLPKNPPGSGWLAGAAEGFDQLCLAAARGDELKQGLQEFGGQIPGVKELFGQPQGLWRWTKMEYLRVYDVSWDPPNLASRNMPVVWNAMTTHFSLIMKGNAGKSMLTAYIDTQFKEIFPRTALSVTPPSTRKPVNWQLAYSQVAVLELRDMLHAAKNSQHGADVPLDPDSVTGKVLIRMTSYTTRESVP